MSLDNVIILTYVDYLRLKRDLKEVGVDLCYTAQTSQPVRLKWHPLLFEKEAFVEHVAQRRPADRSYRIASVVHVKKATWLQSDQFVVAFHAVSRRQEADLERYLSDHHVQSSHDAARELLEKAV